MHRKCFRNCFLGVFSKVSRGNSLGDSGGFRGGFQGDSGGFQSTFWGFLFLANEKSIRIVVPGIQKIRPSALIIILIELNSIKLHSLPPPPPHPTVSDIRPPLDHTHSPWILSPSSFLEFYPARFGGWFVFRCHEILHGLIQPMEYFRTRK